MPGTNKFKTLLSHTLPHCSEKTEETNRCVIGIFAKLFSQYPKNVDVRGIIETSSHPELLARVVEMLVQDGMLSGTNDQMHLTLAGYSAVNDAMKAEPRLAVALREGNSPKPSYDYSTLVLSILRVYSTRRRRK